MACVTRRTNNAYTACLLLVLAGCNAPPATSDSLPPLGESDVHFFEVGAAAETAAVLSSDDAADDSVVLVSDDARKVWIATADKKFGLRVYAIDGAELISQPVGRINNIDALPLQENRWLLAASNRSDISIDFFVADLAAETVSRQASVPLDLEDPYGLCMAVLDGTNYVFVGDKDGLVQQWQVDPDLTARITAEHRFASQTEGCVVDAESNHLYVGEEATGIWQIDLANNNQTLVSIIDGKLLVADVEGLDIYRDTNRNWLLASSQGDNSYLIIDMDDDFAVIGKFRIAANTANGIDGTSETDGIAIFSGSLPEFPAGVFVAQDGENTAPAANQNFKIVDWRAIDAGMANAAAPD